MVTQVTVALASEAAYMASAFKSGQESLPEPLRGTGCWPKVADCKSGSLWKTGLGRRLFQQRAILSLAQTAVVGP